MKFYVEYKTVDRCGQETRHTAMFPVNNFKRWHEQAMKENHAAYTVALDCYVIVDGQKYGLPFQNALLSEYNMVAKGVEKLIKDGYTVDIDLLYSCVAEATPYDDDKEPTHPRTVLKLMRDYLRDGVQQFAMYQVRKPVAAE